MGKVTRRVFMARGAMGAATFGLLGSMPLERLVNESESAAPEAEGVAAAPEMVSGVVVAHIRDIASGEVSVMAGAKEVIIRDPQLVVRMLKAVR